MHPTELDYDGMVVVTYQGVETELFVNYSDNRQKYIIPDIMGLSQKSAESKLKSAGVNYTIMDSDNAYLAYDDVSPGKTVDGYGGYHWNEEEDYCYIYEGEVLEVYISQPAIYITNVSHDINSVGGVDVYIDFVNNSDKTIKYVKFNDVEFYNTVADPAYCEIKKSYKRTLNFTGPLYAGDEKYATWEAVIYNNKTSALVFRTITVDFTDGTSQTINYDAYWYDNRYIGGYPG